MTKKEKKVFGAWLQDIERLKSLRERDEAELREVFKNHIGEALPQANYQVVEAIFKSDLHPIDKFNAFVAWRDTFELDVMLNDRNNLKSKLEAINNGEN